MQLDVLPQRATIDTPVRIIASGVPAGSEVTLRAAMVDHADTRWAAAATFVATADGVVDPSVQAPTHGTYPGVDAMGLCWSMQPQVEEPLRAPFELVHEEPLQGVVTAEVAGEAAPEVSLERLIVSDGLRVKDVREAGLVGRFFQPAAGGPHP